MGKGGFLIRFIDIGLLILFGFLMISDIEQFSNIQMPGSSDDAVQEDPQKIVLVTVGIAANGDFSVTELDGRTGVRGISTTEELERHLIELQAEKRADGKTIVVLISPSEEVIIQRLVDVMDVCDRNGILKNINAESLKL